MGYIKKYTQIPQQVKGLNIFDGKEITLLILEGRADHTAQTTVSQETDDS